MSVPCFWSWHDHREAGKYASERTAPSPHLQAAHLPGFGLTPVRMDERENGTRLLTISRQRRILMLRWDGTLDGGIC